MTATVRIIVAFLLAILSVGALLPTAIALGRNHPKVVSVVIWNTVGMLLFGLGWIVALVIALTGSSTQATVIVHNHIAASDKPTGGSGV